MPIKDTTFKPFNILGEGTGPDWKIHRYPYDASGGAVPLANMQGGYLLKFNTAGDKVTSAVAADDAALGGVLVDKPDPADDPDHPTVAIALQGTFNENQVHYADYDPDDPEELSAAAKARLRELNIFLDPAVKAGPFAP